jgi:hypothetical protein
MRRSKKIGRIIKGLSCPGLEHAAVDKTDGRFLQISESRAAGDSVHPGDPGRRQRHHRSAIAGMAKVHQMNGNSLQGHSFGRIAYYSGTLEL